MMDEIAVFVVLVGRVLFDEGVTCRCEGVDYVLDVDVITPLWSGALASGKVKVSDAASGLEAR